ncbi:MAG: cation diffusion facilitator family transporter [Bacteroidales bacterium]|jgi:cobalt-zinc-cadmium efflux system protein|nr:cation diffusion facilitator family transporter [Bacteroidales bacterium]
MGTHVHHHSDKGQKGLLISTLLNFFITIVQIIGGLLSNSLALLSDALHNLGDTIAIFLAYLANRFGNKAANESKTFGYKRIEIIAALFNAVSLIVISIFLFVEAGKRFANPEEIKGGLMLIVAISGLLANLISVFILNPHKAKNLNIKAAYLHLLGDTLSSFAVILGGIAIILWDIYWIDPLITIAIGVYLIIHTLKILKHSINILMQASPENIDIQRIAKQIKTVDNRIENVHHIHAWTLDDMRCFIECHIKLQENITVSETEKISQSIENNLKESIENLHLTIQFEHNLTHPDNLIHQENTE